jgi:hypothetical protein
MHVAAPMWRNGRRNGLKIRSREKRGVGSNPTIGTYEKLDFTYEKTGTLLLSKFT